MSPSTAIASVSRAGQVSILALILAAGLVSPARAIDLDNDNLLREDTIAQMQHKIRWDARPAGISDEAPKPSGIRVGNYLIHPSLSVATTFDDNVYASSTNRKSDVRVDVVPVIRGNSQFARHAFDFALGGRMAKYAELDNYDHNDVFGTATGALHFDHAHTLSFAALSEIAHDTAITPDRPFNASEPTRVWHNRYSLGFRRDAGRLWAAIGAKYESWNFDDVRAFDGTVIDQDVRDFTVYSSDVRAGYRFSPGYELQGKVTVLRQVTPGETALNRDATGFEVAAGVVGELNPLVRWRLFGGYAQREFDRQDIGTVGSAVAEAEVQWLITRLMSLTFLFKRELQDDSTGTGTGARIDNKALARAQYQLLRNLMFTIQGEYRLSDFLGADRTDQLWVGRVGLQYFYTQNLGLNLSWEHQYRLSDVSEAEFTRNRFWLEGKLRF